LFTPDVVIPILKIAVAAVTVILVASLLALAAGKKRLHGRLNMLFFALTMVAVLGFEVVVRLLNPAFTSSFTPEQRQSLQVHLCFSVPAALVLPAMLYSGSTHRRWHVLLSYLFGVLWIGTFVTGIFYLPHSFPAP
jgi:hypothetical protein